MVLGRSRPSPPTQPPPKNHVATHYRPPIHPLSTHSPPTTSLPLSTILNTHRPFLSNDTAYIGDSLRPQNQPLAGPPPKPRPPKPPPPTHWPPLATLAADRHCLPAVPAAPSTVAANAGVDRLKLPLSGPVGETWGDPGFGFVAAVVPGVPGGGLSVVSAPTFRFECLLHLLRSSLRPPVASRGYLRK